MRRITRAAVAASALVAMLIALGGTASAAPVRTGPVFVQTDNLVGNQVVAYDRAADGTLTQAGVYNTGGKGGALEGAVVDHLASQGSLAYDRQHRLLFAVNAGSDTVSVFGVNGDSLALRQVIDSGGSFPASIAVQARARLRPQRRRRSLRPGLQRGRRPAGAAARLQPLARAERDPDAAFHQHPRSGRLLAGRPPAAGHHQGQRQRDRRVPDPPARPALGRPGREFAAG